MIFSHGQQVQELKITAQSQGCTSSHNISFLVILLKNLSLFTLPMYWMIFLINHCPLELSVDEENWSPKPLRMLKCWESFPGYDIFVRKKWQSFQVDGWGDYVLKEKFKLIKLALKEWHQHHSQNLPANISSLKDKISVFDLKGESDLLLDDEVEELHGLLEHLFSLTRINSSIRW